MPKVRVFWGAFYALFTLLVLAAQDLVKVNMKGSVFYGRPRQRYGPGQGILVPRGLALSLGLQPIADTDATVAEVQQPTAPKGKGRKSTGEKAPAGGEQTNTSELEAVDGIGPELAAALAERGITTREQFRGAGDDRLLEVPGIGPATLEKLRAEVEKED